MDDGRLTGSRFKRINPKAARSAATGGALGPIPVSWLHTHAYCELQLFLEKALGIEAPPTPEMLAGSRQHAFLDAEHDKKAEIELTVAEAAERAQLEAVTMVSRDISVKGTSLYGRIDEVVFEPDRIVIIDDKPSAQPYFTNRLQVWGYCRAFQETYSPEMPIFGALRQEDSGQIVWLEQFLDEHASLVDVTVNRIRAVLAGAEKPDGSENARKCRPCRFKGSCPARAGVF